MAVLIDGINLTEKYQLNIKGVDGRYNLKNELIKFNPDNSYETQILGVEYNPERELIIHGIVGGRNKYLRQRNFIELMKFLLNYQNRECILYFSDTRRFARCILKGEPFTVDPIGIACMNPTAFDISVRFETLTPFSYEVEDKTVAVESVQKEEFELEYDLLNGTDKKSQKISGFEPLTIVNEGDTVKNELEKIPYFTKKDYGLLEQNLLLSDNWTTEGIKNPSDLPADCPVTLTNSVKVNSGNYQDLFNINLNIKNGDKFIITGWIYCPKTNGRVNGTGSLSFGGLALIQGWNYIKMESVIATSDITDGVLRFENDHTNNWTDLDNTCWGVNFVLKKDTTLVTETTEVPDGFDAKITPSFAVEEGTKNLCNPLYQYPNEFQGLTYSDNKSTIIECSEGDVFSISMDAYSSISGLPDSLRIFYFSFMNIDDENLTSGYMYIDSENYNTKKRYSKTTITAPAGTVKIIVYFTNNGSEQDNKIFVRRCQIEKKSFATSFTEGVRENGVMNLTPFTGSVSGKIFRFNMKNTIPYSTIMTDAVEPYSQLPALFSINGYANPSLTDFTIRFMKISASSFGLIAYINYASGWEVAESITNRPITELADKFNEIVVIFKTDKSCDVYLDGVLSESFTWATAINVNHLSFSGLINGLSINSNANEWNATLIKNIYDYKVTNWQLKFAENGYFPPSLSTKYSGATDWFKLLELYPDEFTRLVPRDTVGFNTAGLNFDDFVNNQIKPKFNIENRGGNLINSPNSNFYGDNYSKINEKIYISGDVYYKAFDVLGNKTAGSTFESRSPQPIKPSTRYMLYAEFSNLPPENQLKIQIEFFDSARQKISAFLFSANGAKYQGFVTPTNTAFHDVLIYDTIHTNHTRSVCEKIMLYEGTDDKPYTPSLSEKIEINDFMFGYGDVADKMNELIKNGIWNYEVINNNSNILSVGTLENVYRISVDLPLALSENKNGILIDKNGRNIFSLIDFYSTIPHHYVSGNKRDIIFLEKYKIDSCEGSTILEKTQNYFKNNTHILFYRKTEETTEHYVDGGFCVIPGDNHFIVSDNTIMTLDGHKLGGYI